MAEAHFWYMIWFMISERIITRYMVLCEAGVQQKSNDGTEKLCNIIEILSALELSSCGLVVFTDMSTFILTECSNFKIFLKDNYAVTLGSCYYLPNKC